jgi:SHS2 domain-containing protein
MSTPCHFTELGHTSEIGLGIRAGTIEQLFACAAEGMFTLTRAKPERSAASVERSVMVESIDAESLLIDWLSELLYLYETTGALFVDCHVERCTLNGPTAALAATVVGYPPDVPPAVHVKAVTYHDLRLEQNADGWQAQIYFDI